MLARLSTTPVQQMQAPDSSELFIAFPEASAVYLLGF